MACSSPLYGYRFTHLLDYETGEITPGSMRIVNDGKEIHFVKTQDMRYKFMRLGNKISIDKNTGVQVVFDSPEKRLHYFEQLSKDPKYDTALIPCGRCLECRLEYSRQWANRCMLEASTSSNNWFLTFTYDDDHLPKNEQGYPTLVKKDLQKFNKDLRRHFDYHDEVQGIRFFAAGEYGDSTARPHYHGIYFNLPITDLVFLYQKNGSAYFNSPTIDKLWNKGYVVITDVSWDSCAYVARYVVKKQKGDGAQVYKDLNIVPEFCIMSRRPGIASQYYEDNKDKIYKNDSIIIPGGERVRPSKFYDKKYDQYDPFTLALIKTKRINIAKTSLELQLQQTDLDPQAYQQVCHEVLVNKVKQLKRDQV